MNEKKITGAASKGESSRNNFFPPSGRQLPTKERRLAINCLRQQMSDRIKAELGVDYTEELAELVFSNFIKSPDGEKLVQEVLKTYLQMKIDNEKKIFSGNNTKL